jgi:transcriptional regulator with XRE-family HTH domain
MIVLGVVALGVIPAHSATPPLPLPSPFGLQDDLPMRRKSKSRSTKLGPRSAGTADIRMGRRIRLGRLEAGISQKELGDKLGVTFQQVQKYERGFNRVSAARLQLIAEIFEVDIPFFYDSDGNEQAVDSLLVLKSLFSLRLLRAYTAIKDQAVQRKLVILIEMIAASQR